MDGALGSRGAALLDPYADDAGKNGLLVSKPEHIEAVAEQALKAGFQVNTHAIGDRAQPARARRVRAGAQGGAGRRSPVPHRARADHQPRRHPALRIARRHSVDAGEPSDERHVLGRQSPRLDALVRRLRLAVAARQRLDHPERQRLPGRAGEPADLVPCRVHAAGRAQLAAERLVSRSRR